MKVGRSFPLVLYLKMGEILLNLVMFPWHKLDTSMGDPPHLDKLAYKYIIREQIHPRLFIVYIY